MPDSTIPDITYGQTPRGFTTAKLAQHGDVLLEVQASSAVNLQGRPSDALIDWRDENGCVMPGSSYLWLFVQRANTESRCGAHLSRVQVAALAGILTRWLATGFVQGEVSQP